MLIVYDSAMGKTERFAKRLGLPVVKVSDDLTVNEPFVLITYTTGGRTEKAKAPDSTMRFLERNHKNMLGVASSGHMNWGKERFAKAGDIVSSTYNVPLILKFEMGGFPSDIQKFKEGVLRLNGGTNIS